MVVLAVAAFGFACPLENPRLGCPANWMFIGAQVDNGDDLGDLTGITLDGAACPAQVPACVREQSLDGGLPGPCQSFWIDGQAGGTCRATLTFSDRDTFVAETSFGPYEGGRCSGYPAQGNSVFYVPARPIDAGAHD